MSADLEKARQYRERAEEIRIMASDKRGAAIRDSLQSIAATYDRLAQSLEAIDKTNRALEKSKPTT